MGNVIINGRTAVHAGSGGTLTTIDVCWTKVGKPVVRIPYTNIAKSSDAAKTAGSVLINGQPVCNKASIFAVSTGDEPGDHLGVKSGTIKGKAEFITSSSNVFIEGIPAERQGDLMVSNNRNTPPMPLMQPGAPPPASLQTTAVKSRTSNPPPFKIAVEVAGGKSHNLKGSLVANSGKTIRDIPVGSTARVGGHRRELIIEEIPEGNYDLLLRFPDERYDFYQIPLGRQIPTWAKEKENTAWDTVLVPVVPRIYLGEQPDRVETTYPRCDMETRTGWIYIYLDGHLWRELQVLPEGGVKDVNLAYEKGRNQRVATAGSDYVIVLPYKINGEKPMIEMCYSEVQWDWARIDALGGIAKDDPRQQHGTPVQAGSGSDTARLRGQRLQRIDLSEYPNFARTDGPVGGADEFHFALRKRKHLRAWHDSGLPVVYLHDSIGVAKTLATELYACKLRYLNGRNQAAEAAGSKYAMAEMIFQMGLDSPKAAELVAMDELRDLLKWDRQIEHLHALEKAAVTLGQYITQPPQQGVPDVHVAMKDYAEHATVESLLQGQLLSSELVGQLIYGEGRQYLAKSLNQPDHFLVGALNPSRKKLEALGKDVNKIAEFFENMAAAAQDNSQLRKQLFELLAKLVEQISDGEFSLAEGQFDMAPVLVGSAAATAKGGYLNSSFTALLRGRLDVTQWVVVTKGMNEGMEMTFGRSVEWLQTNHPLIKLNAIRLFGVLEVMNLGNALRAHSKQSGSRIEQIRAAASTFTLTSLGFTYLKDVKNIGAGWDNKALPKWQQHTLKMKRIFVTGGAHGFGFIGNVIIVALAWNDAWAEYKKGNTGGAVAATVAALGSTILAAATALGGVVEMNTLGAKGFQGARATRATKFGGTKVPLTRTLQASRVGAGSLVGIVVMVVGGLLMYYFSRTPLEEFLARGPFGKEKNNRCKGSKTFETWQDDAVAEAALFNILFSPKLEPKLQRTGFIQARIEFKVHLPLLLEGKTRVDYSLYGNTMKGLGKSIEKKLIPSSQEGTLTPNQDGSHTLTIIYEPGAIQGFASFEAQALVDLYGDGHRVLPVKIDNGAISGHDPVVVQFPEALQA